jgi:hypothetical protein
MKFKFILSILIIASIFSSCLKDECLYENESGVQVENSIFTDTAIIFKVDTFLLKATSGFNVGSFWVYKEVNSGALDTVTIIDYLTAINFGGITTDYQPCTNLKYNHIDYFIYLQSSYYKRKYKDTHYSIGITENKQLLYERKSEAMLWQPTETLIINEYPNDNSFDYVSVNFDGTNYANTVYREFKDETLYTQDSISSSEINRIYCISSIGMVKRENITQNETWELINYVIK